MCAERNHVADLAHHARQATAATMRVAGVMHLQMFAAETDAAVMPIHRAANGADDTPARGA